MSENKPQEHPICIRRGFMNLVGNLAVASLLSQVDYWYRPSKKTGLSKMTARRDGVMWIAKTREEWCRETGITLKQYKRAVAILKEKGLVSTRMMHFRRQPMTHLRLHRDVLDAALASLEPKGTNHSCPKGPAAWPHEYQRSSPKGTNPLYTETTEETTAEITFCEGVPPVAGETGDEDGKTAEGIQENWKNAKEACYGDKQTQSIQSYWKSSLAQRTGQLQLDLTSKNAGQLKKFEQDLGQQAYPAIDYALENWWKFSKEVENQKGLKLVPEQPNLAFMVTHREVLLNLLSLSVAKPKKVFVMPTPAAESTQANFEKEVPYMPTDEEIAATIKSVRPQGVKCFN